MTHGVLVQEWGGVKKLFAFLSKFLDLVIRGWPTCFQAVSAMVTLIEESRKLTFGGKLIFHTPHAVRNMISQRSSRWLTDLQILKYEVVLIHNYNLVLIIHKRCNPAQFLYGEPQEGLFHDCLEVVNFQTKLREDIMDQPLPEGERIFIDRSTRCIQGKRCQVTRWWMGLT